MTDLRDMSSALEAKVDQLNGRKVFIFGDVGIDEYVQGHVGRISPEAPVPVVEVEHSDKKLGLSGNVAANVQSLGGTPLLFSLVGDDAHADSLRTLLTENGISDQYLMTDPLRKTTTKLRVMSGQHHIVRVDYENREPVADAVIAKYKEALLDGIRQCDAVIIQDYAKGLVSESSCRMIIEMAHQEKKKVLVDPYRSTPLEFYKGADFMTPNRDEAFELARQIPKPNIWKNVDLIGQELMSIIESPQMVITLGAEGIKIFEQNQDVFHLPTFARKVFDVTGAGDTVIAAFAMGLASGWDLQESGFLANMAAGFVVGQVGAVACSQQDLVQFLNSQTNK